MTISEWYKPEINVLLEDLKKEHLKLSPEKKRFEYYFRSNKALKIIEKADFQKKTIDYLEKFSKIFIEDKKSIIDLYGNYSYKSKVETIEKICKSIMLRDDYISSFVDWIRSHPKDFVKEAFPTTDDTIIKSIQSIYEKIIASEMFEKDLKKLRNCIVSALQLPKEFSRYRNINGSIGLPVSDYTPLGLFQYNADDFGLREVKNVAPHFALSTVYKVVNKHFAVFKLTETRNLETERDFEDFLAKELKYDD
ncbi:MAG: hypothetical protein VX777_03870 [Chlamydiota bacterium]|nr:hypothetical protein [Chlamydiota bacterium]